MSNIVISLLFLLLSWWPRPGVLPSYDTAVSASIGTTVTYSLFGYTSSYATVHLDGIGLMQQTRANTDGYFSFSSFPAPQNIEEFCLTAVDTNGGTSVPLCVPAPKNGITHAMGPYLLSPTIRVSSAQTPAGSTVVISGKTIPSTSINLSTYTAPASVALIPAVYAAQTVRSLNAAKDGSYSYQYSSPDTQTVRVFTQGVYEKTKTPKSNTLTFSFYGFLTMILMYLHSFLKAFGNSTLIIILEALTIAAIAFYILWRKKHKLAAVPHRENSIIVYEDNAIVKYDAGSVN